MTEKNLLISFSGIDGSGKSTHIENLIEYLEDNGSNPVYLWTRGGYTPLFNTLKKVLRKVSGKRIVPESGHSKQRQQYFSRKGVRKLWLGIALIDLIFVYGIAIRWWNLLGRTVICDRYIWDTLIDFRMNFPEERVEDWPLWRFLYRVTPYPDIKFLLQVPLDESIRRTILKDEPFSDSAAVRAKRLEDYEDVAKIKDIILIDGNCSIKKISKNIIHRINDS